MNKPTAKKRGFTLIELVVSMMLAGICSLLAGRLFVEAYRQYYAYRDRDAIFFDESRQEALARKMLYKHPGKCREDSSYAFTGERADSLRTAFPYAELRCEADLATGRVLVCPSEALCLPVKQ